MTIQEYKCLFALRFEPEVEFAMQFLEDRGGRMSVDFGYSNSLRKATDILLMEIELAEGYGHGV